MTPHTMTIHLPPYTVQCEPADEGTRVMIYRGFLPLVELMVDVGERICMARVRAIADDAAAELAAAAATN